MNIFERLVSLYKDKKIDLQLTFNDITYDRNFSYNSSTDILCAESSQADAHEFGGNGKTIMEYVISNKIDIKLKFK